MKFKTGRTLAALAIVGAFVVAILPSVSSASSPTVSAKTFNPNFTTMAYLKSVAAMGHGMIGVILPDTVSSNRYVDFDAPFLAKAFKDAGLKSSQYKIQNADGSDTTQYTDAQADIAEGAKVLLFDPLDQTTGAIVEAYAAARGVKVIDYDRLTLGGARSYYVSFDNVQVGKLLGTGLLSCITAWKIASPTIYEMYGSPTDNNATLFADGYKPVLSGSGDTVIDENVGTWTPSVALTDFEGAYSANPKINAVLTPNDENAAPIIAHLQSQGLKPDTIPFTGQDATTTGFQNIISGYQCGTVYKPFWEETQAAAALAVYLRAGEKPPAALLNGTVTDVVATINSLKHVPSVLLTPTWVTASNIETTAIKDKQEPASDICTNVAPTVSGATEPTYAADCTTYGIH